MATIKLQPSGAVVIKDGKVSCTCCEVGCPYYGIYNSSEFDFSYSFDDIPEELELTGVATPFDVVVNVFKNSITISIDGLIELAYVESGFFNIDEFGFYQGGWGIGLYADGWRNAFYTQSFDESWFEDTASEYSSFLIANFDTQYRTLDYFANTYTVSNVSASFTVNRPTEIDPYYNDIIVPARNRICNPDTDPYEYANPGLWENTTGVQLYFGAVYEVFDSSIIFDSSSKWTIRNSGQVFRKTGLQNTPVGSYAGGYTVS
jgi:hypothetical protein